MPIPRKNESRNAFVSRAIPILRAEGHSQKEAIGKAEGIYTHHKKKKRNAFKIGG